MRHLVADCGFFLQSVLPFFVATKMTRIRKPTFDKPTPDRYVAAELGTVGLQSQTNGYFPHAVMVSTARPQIPSSPIMTVAGGNVCCSRTRLCFLPAGLGDHPAGTEQHRHLPGSPDEPFAAHRVPASEEAAGAEERSKFEEWMRNAWGFLLCAFRKLKCNDNLLWWDFTEDRTWSLILVKIIQPKKNERAFVNPAVVSSGHGDGHFYTYNYLFLYWCRSQTLQQTNLQLSCVWWRFVTLSFLIRPWAHTCV